MRYKLKMINKPRMINEILKNEKGEGYIDVMIFMMVILMVITFFVDLLPIFVTKYNLDMFSAEVVRAAEISGSTTSGAVNATVAGLSANTGITPTLYWEQGGTRVQLGNEIVLRVEITETLSLFGVGHFPIRLNSRSRGISEVYYK